MIHTKGIFTILVVWLIFFIPAYSQYTEPARPLSVQLELTQSGLPVLSGGLTENQEIILQETCRQKPGTAFLAGFDWEANVYPLQFGKRNLVNGNTLIWRMIVTSRGALGMGLVFEGFDLTEGQQMYVYTPDLETVHGPYDESDNSASGIFTSPLSAGDTLIVEIHSPAMGAEQSLSALKELRLKSVMHLSDGGDSQWFTDTKSIGAAGTCNVNINCVEGQNWQRQKRGVARIFLLSGGRRFFCTGTLINNTRNDGAMLFLTAHHCGHGATPQELQQWQFYFHFERPGCANEGTPPTYVLTGAEVLASAFLANGSDFQLLRLTQTPPREWNLFWNGWDRSAEPSNSGVTIHHPAGDVKKISTYWETTVPATPTFNGMTMAPNAAWRVVWSPTINGHGVTEGGSSGSPLFNANGVLIGTLSGGSATCAQRTLPDFFGRFSHHWDKNGTHYTVSLAPHLDPLGTGTFTLSGFDPLVPASIGDGKQTPDTIANLILSTTLNKAAIRFTQNLPKATVSVFNAQAKLIYRQILSNIQNGQMELIETSNLAPGMYLIQISTPNQSITLRLMLPW